MVHRGPAKGCQRCKDRHIKCDLERPACKQCVRLNFGCPGYRHELDVVLRDQTASVVSRHRNQRRKLPRSSTQSNVTASKTLSLPKHLVEDLELHALTFFFSNTVSTPTKDWRASHGHFDFILPLYENATFDSPIALATSWLAILMMEVYSTGRPYPGEGVLKTKVIESILAAIKDPINSFKNETLAAVLLLTYGDYLRAQRYGSNMTSTIHQEGAESLIRQRGVLNFQDKISLSLFDAVRHNAVGLLTSTDSKPRNWDLWNLQEDIRQLCDSYTPATELDACGVVMIDLRSQLKSNGCYCSILLRENLVKLLERLRRWRYRVPSEWLYRDPTFNSTNYPSPDICHLVNSWHLLQLEVSHLIKELDMRTDGIEALDSNSASELEWINQIIASEDSILSNDENQIDYLSPMTPKQSALVDEFPSATAQQFHCTPIGSRLFGQTLARLDLILSNALEDLTLPAPVASYYRKAVFWSRSERHKMRQAFPLANR